MSEHQLNNIARTLSNYSEDIIIGTTKSFAENSDTNKMVLNFWWKNHLTNNTTLAIFRWPNQPKLHSHTINKTKS